MKHIDKEFCLPFDNSNPEFWMRIEHLGRYLYAADYIKRNNAAIVLDVACADGYGCREMADTDAMIYGIDYNQELIDLAKNTAAIEKKENLHFAAANLNTASLDDIPKPDLVTCFDTLEHLKSPQKILSDVCSVMKKNGSLLLSVPKAKYEPIGADGKPTNEFHLHRFSKEDLIDLIKNAGFRIEKVLYQPYSNICMSLEKNTLRDTNTRIKKARSYFDQSKEAMRFFARMFGMPTADLEKFSYSILITAKKK